MGVHPTPGIAPLLLPKEQPDGYALEVEVVAEAVFQEAGVGRLHVLRMIAEEGKRRSIGR